MGRGKRTQGRVSARPQGSGRPRKHGRYDYAVEGYEAPDLSGLRGPSLEGVDSKVTALVARVRTVLSDDLRKEEYRGHENPIVGHCYVASEALYHLLGGKEAGWKPVGLQHEGGPHWWLANADGRVIDATADQFDSAVPYAEGRGQGFLTRQPSERAEVALLRLGVPLAELPTYSTFVDKIR